MKVKFNAQNLQSERKQHFLVLERWGGMDNAASYTEQAQSLRRSLDSIEAVEKAFDTEVVTMLHKVSSVPGLATLASVEDNESLDRVISENFAHARMASEDREVLPLADWDSSREDLARLIYQLESASLTETTGDAADRILNPVDPDVLHRDEPALTEKEQI